MTAYLSTTFDRARRPPTVVLDELRQYGVTAVELGSTHEPEARLDAALCDEFGDFAFVTHNFFPPPADPSLVINFTDPRPSERARSLQLATENVRFAARVGSRLHTVHPGFLAPATAGQGEDRNYDFQFDTAASTSADVAFSWMLEALDVLGRRAEECGVPLAVETQGSVENRDMCLFQTPQEARALADVMAGRPVGISVNLGHLNLAAAAWDFDRLRFIDDLADRIVAFELSHNDGRHDLHLPLRPGEWYWDVIGDPRFSEVPMILELRDVDTADACRHYDALVECRARSGAGR